MNLLFVARRGDRNAVQALEVLQALGHPTQLLDTMETTPAESIALFTPLKTEFQGSRGKYLRCSCVKLNRALTPDWVTTPLRVAVIRTKKQKDATPAEHGTIRKVRFKPSDEELFRLALEEMVRGYQRWLAEEDPALVPWSTTLQDPSITPGSNCGKAISIWLERHEVHNLRKNWVIPKKTTLGAGIETLNVCGWQVNFTARRFAFPTEAVKQALGLLGKWAAVFTRENTWVQNNLRVPSLFVRLDCVVEGGRLLIYEVEERPAGLGLTFVINQDFAAQLRAIAKVWPPFNISVSPNRAGTDDRLWHHEVQWGQRASHYLVLVRAEPEEEYYHSFEPHSVSSVKAKGNKTYGERLGLWRRVACHEELQWDQPFALKPLQGSKLCDLEIWDPAKRPGSSKRKQIEETLLRRQAMYYQALHEPMPTSIPAFPWMIFRVFFGYNPQTKQWLCLGGNWNARHNLRIHGASDALFGPLEME